MHSSDPNARYQPHLECSRELVRDACAPMVEEHRLEPVRTVQDVLYVNDSKATNVNAAWYALTSQKQPVVWLMGGQDRGNDYTDLLPAVERHVRAIAVVCARGWEKKPLSWWKPLKVPMVHCPGMPSAVRWASEQASAGDVVLLSPACASFDLYDNYEHRGRAFKQAVATL